MDAELLKILRGLCMYKEVWDREDEIDLADPASRLEYLRVCRDTERFDKALPLIESVPDTDPIPLSERLAVLDRLGDSERLRTVLDTALGRLAAAPDGSLPDPFLTCAAARAQASFGRLREGLRVMSPYADQMHSRAPVFSTYMFLFIRLGWYRATHKLIQRVGDLVHEPEGPTAATRQIRRLVSGARALGRIGDVETALALFDRAHWIADRPDFNPAGIHYPWVWRWHAYLLRTNALWEQMDELKQRARQAPLWVSNRNPLPRAMVADSSPFQVELAMRVMNLFDGTEREALIEASGRLDDSEAAMGSSADLIQAKGEILHQLDDEQGLLALTREHPYSVPPRIEYVRMLTDRGMLNEASEALEGILGDRPRNPEALQLRVAVDADRLAPDPDRKRRVESAHKLLDEFPVDAPALAITAERLAQNGHFNDSEALFQQLTRYNPVYGLGWAGRLRAATWNHDWALVARIEKEFEERRIPEEDFAVEGLDELYGYWFEVARALARAAQIDFDAADECIARATGYWRHRDIRPEFKSHSSDPLWAWTVERLRWRRRTDAAADRCVSFVDQAPRNPYFLVKYGWVLLERHDFKGAEAQFQKALKIRPGSSGAWKGLLRSLRFQLRFAEAHEYAERARLILRPDPDIWCEHAELCLAEHDTERALGLLDEAIRFAPNHVNTLAMRVRCLSMRRDHQSAIAEAEFARSRRRDSVEILEAHCKALLRHGRDKESLEVMKGARREFEDSRGPSGPAGPERGDLSIELLSASVFAQCGADLPNCREVIERLGRHETCATAIGTAAGLWRLHLELAEASDLVTGFPGWEGEFELLTEYAEIAAAYGPERPPAGSSADRVDDRDGYSLADYHLARARHFDPYSISTLQRQVHLWNAQQRFDDSLALLTDAGRRFGEHFMVELLTAETHVLRGRPDEAIRTSAAVLDLFESRRQQPIRMRNAHLRAVRATGDLDRALRLARELVEDCPASRRAHLALARSLEDFNESSEALEHLERSLLELPLYPPVGENAALFCRLRGEYERGHELIKRALRHYDYDMTPEAVFKRADAGLLAELALTLPWVGLEDEAKKRIGDLRERTDVYAKSLGYISSGWHEVRAKNPDEAIEEFGRALATGMCANEARYGLAQAYMVKADRTHDNDLGNTLLHRARALAQQNIDAADSERSLILAGRACYQLGDWKEAEECFRASITKHRVHGAHLELAVVLNHMGRLEAALAATEEGQRWAAADPRLLAVLGLTKLRMVVEERHDGKLLKEGVGDIDRALDAAPTDPTVLSAVVYAANHTDLYLPTTAYSYLEKALDDKVNRASFSTMKHLYLMLAELTLRYRRIDGLRLRWTRGPRRWAELALAYSDEPRARAIAKSFWPRRRTAKIAERPVGKGMQGEAGGIQRRTEVPPWPRYTVIGVGLVASLVGVVGAVVPSGGPEAVYAAAVGAALAGSGLFANRLSGLAFRGLKVDISPATEMAGTLSLPAEPPMRSVVMPQTPVNRSDGQWRLSESHRQLLGPAVGPMITGHYTYRDANFPWKTR
ncbi:tetratricopeptide repeat protein [Glycomyces salinus]|uniref:tetratricopeptide repeat protein n=1 Tax=Glycomyces salinus TaxID=980294 RepID=UPI0018EA3A5C|nr:tetratricopeptide repeat protein [Glycomyces salinus]